MGTELAVVEQRATLAELSETYRQEDELALQAGVAMVEHAIAAGQALLAAKQQLPGGKWRAWLTDSFGEQALVRARQYMRIARYRDAVRAEGCTTILSAKQMLVGLPDSRLDPVLRDEARELVKTGMTQREVAVQLGVSAACVWNWLNPEKWEAAKRAQATRTMKARRALAAQERAASVRRMGGPASRAFEHVRKALQLLDQATDEAEGVELKRHLRTAMTGCHKAEDEIVKVSKLS